MLKQIQNYINLLILCLTVSNFAFSQIEGCTDPEAYNCEDDAMMVDMHGNEFPNYIFDVGGIMYYVKQVYMIECHSSPRPTIGVEIDLHLIDDNSFGLMNCTSAP